VIFTKTTAPRNLDRQYRLGDGPVVTEVRAFDASGKQCNVSGHPGLDFIGVRVAADKLWVSPEVTKSPEMRISVFGRKT
jgi:hypothetical protein